MNITSKAERTFNKADQTPNSAVNRARGTLRPRCKQQMKACQTQHMYGTADTAKDARFNITKHNMNSFILIYDVIPVNDVKTLLY